MKIKDIPMFVKSFFFNFKHFGFKTALVMPILVGVGVDVKNVQKGTIEFCKPVHRSMVYLGCSDGSAGLWDKAGRKGYFSTDKGSKVIFSDNVTLTRGFLVRCFNNGELKFGDDFSANPYLRLFCWNKVSFGDHCMLGWNITINDGDGHALIDNNTKARINPDKPITLGDHVWISAESSLLKGAAVGNDCIIGYQTVVGKAFDESNVIIAGGYPGKIVKTDVNWVREL